MADQDIVAERLEGTFGDVAVVDGVDIAVGGGEVFACVGPPGAGRTPLIRMLCGLLTPTGGTAKVAGFDVASQPGQVRRRVGLVADDSSLDPQATARQVLRFQGRLYGMKGALLDSRVGVVAELARLDGALDKHIAACDAPEKRRVALAAAMIHGPQVVFLDEVTAGLDPADRQAFLADLRDAQRALAITVFLATQATAEADQIADRVAIMERGRIVAEGTLSELKGSVGSQIIVLRVQGPVDDGARVARTVNGVDDVVVNGREITLLAKGGPAVLGPLTTALGNNRVVVSELSLRASTLDDVFLELTGVRLEGLSGRATMTFPTGRK
ncbi:MAG: ATP-binding cassette domain-containing protein [Acidimicrobiales bacterium]